MDKYILFWVYQDRDDDPYIIRNPPETLNALLAEWNALDRQFCEGLPCEWQEVNVWLAAKGIEIIEAESIYLDDCLPSVADDSAQRHVNHNGEHGNER